MERVLLVGEHMLLLQGLKKLLEQQADVYATVRLEEADETVRQSSPDCVVVESSNVPAVLDRLARLRAMAGGVPLLVIAPGDPEQFLATLRAGARGFIARDASPTSLVDCVRAVARGEWAIPRELIGVLAQEYVALATTRSALQPHELTPREREVLQMLVRGLSAQRIGQELFLSESAVRGVIRSIARKLGAGNRVQMVTQALQRGLVNHT